MAGILLRQNFNAGVSNYTPLTPASAAPPSSNAGSIGQMAYGISGTGAADTRPVAGIGSVCVGTIALLALVYLWWSLPR